MKLCTKCKETKPETAFGKDRSRPDGLQHYCRTCCNAYQSKFRYDNKEAVSAERADYYRKNRKKVLRRMQRWQQENPEKVRLLTQRRKSLRAGLFDDGSITLESVEAVFRKFDNRCAYCGAKGELHRDHVVPVALGGPHIIENIVPACRSCNASKASSDVGVWYDRVFGLPLPQPILDAAAAVLIFRRAA